jgi:nucleoside-diphosphate-sugar epimerase
MVVVTGANGFIGRAVCAHLRGMGWPVRGLVRTLDSGTAARAEFMAVGDLATIGEHALRNALRGATAVVHLAARVHRPADANGDALAPMRRINVDVTERIARAAAAAAATHCVFASSVKVNGEVTMPGRPFCESDPPDPHDDYAATKWEAEQALAAVAEETGMRVTALRLPLTYGPGAKGNLATLARAIRAGLPLPLAGIRNRRSVLGVGNCSAAIDVLLRSDDPIGHGRMIPYLLADAETVSTPDLVRAMAKALCVEPRLFAVAPGLLRFAGACVARAPMVERLVGSLEVDTAAFRSRFGWTPPIPLADGLAAAMREAPSL